MNKQSMTWLAVSQMTDSPAMAAQMMNCSRRTAALRLQELSSKRTEQMVRNNYDLRIIAANTCGIDTEEFAVSGTDNIHRAREHSEMAQQYFIDKESNICTLPVQLSFVRKDSMANSYESSLDAAAMRQLDLSMAAERASAAKRSLAVQQ